VDIVMTLAWPDKAYMTCDNCNQTYAYLVTGAGKDRDVVFLYGGQRHTKCPHCGSDLRQQWWNGQLRTWRESVLNVPFNK
jgi:hypothetical protein